MTIRKRHCFARAGALLIAVCMPWGALQAATLTIVNGNDPGVGFNDPTAVTPVTGNPGTTLGEQRLNVFQAAADAWGDIVDSTITIPILAGFIPLDCNPSSGVLGAASPATQIHGGGLGPVWHPFALANAREGIDIGIFIGLPPNSPNIVAAFNSDVDDDPGCLTGMTWWYGIDSPAPAGTFDLFSTVFHEIAHGLGFSTTVDRVTGAKLDGMDDVYMQNLENHSTGESWPDMTNGERVASAIDTGDLHWTGASAVAQSGVLSAGTHPTGHLQMYAPDPLEPGSSTTHWDTALFPNEVMEPFAVSGAQDLVTTTLMEDIGWTILTPPGDTTPYDPSDPTQLGLLDGRYVATARYIGSGPDWLNAQRMTVLDSQGEPSQTTGGMAFGNPATMSIGVAVRDACAGGFSADWASVGSMDLALWELEIRRVADGALWTRQQELGGNTSGIDQQAFPCL